MSSSNENVASGKEAKDLVKQSQLEPVAGVLHHYAGNRTQVAFEYLPYTAASTDPQNVLIIVGGLYDGPGSLPYSHDISLAFPEGWTVVSPYLSSSYIGFGVSSLTQDADELAICISYFRGIKKGKFVLMGHSTGCQDVLKYLTGPGHEKRPYIEGGIIQAPASDREGVKEAMEAHWPGLYQESCIAAQQMVDAGEGEEFIPLKYLKLYALFGPPPPISARRWLSFASPKHDGDDDMFSSDLIDEQLMKTFGALPAKTPLCILMSGNDEFVPKSIDKHALLKRWIGIIKKGEGQVDEEYSGIIEDASHNLENDKEAIIKELVSRVCGFCLVGTEATEEEQELENGGKETCHCI